jgi:hypothetical protein
MFGKSEMGCLRMVLSQTIAYFMDGLICRSERTNERRTEQSLAADGATV